MVKAQVQKFRRQSRFKCLLSRVWIPEKNILKMNYMLKRFFTCIGCCVMMFTCHSQGVNHKKHNSSSFDSTKGLKDYYKNYFPIGVAVGPNNLKGDEAKLILQQFNSLSPENAMKMGPVHPEENRYFWRHADSIVTFAQQYGLRVRGHTLCWYNQTPLWLFKDSAA